MNVFDLSTQVWITPTTKKGRKWLQKIFRKEDYRPRFTARSNLRQGPQIKMALEDFVRVFRKQKRLDKLEKHASCRVTKKSRFAGGGFFSGGSVKTEPKALFEPVPEDYPRQKHGDIFQAPNRPGPLLAESNPPIPKPPWVFETFIPGPSVYLPRKFRKLREKVLAKAGRCTHAGPSSVRICTGCLHDSLRAFLEEDAEQAFT